MKVPVQTTASVSRPRVGDPERHFLIFCDESGIHHGNIFGFGSLWLTWERRGDFAAQWSELRKEYFCPGEPKWSKVKPKTLAFYKAAVDLFFERNWLMFHSLVIGKAEVQLSHHQNDWDLARRKHFTMLLAKKIARFAKPGKVYRVRVDPIPSRYSKAEEACETILRNVLALNSRLPPGTIHSVLPVESKETPGIQLCDILLGAVIACRREDITPEGAKSELIEYIGFRLGEELRLDTLPGEKKFNIWRFWDPTSGEPRPEKSRR